MYAAALGNVNTSPFNVSTALLMAFACYVFYLRAKGHSNDTNIPLFYYGLIVYYVVGYGEWTSLPPVVVYVSLILALLLRFEFMNSGFTKFLIALECCGLACIVYYNVATILGWS
jgi:hypothetical protein